MPRTLKFLSLLCLILPVLTACSEHPDSPPQKLAPSHNSGAPGIVKDDRITEASGMIASRRNPGWIWVHNDSGDLARLYAMNTQGDSLAELRLKNVIARDWEDIAIGPGSQPDVPYIYIGDIGDNLNTLQQVSVYRFPEPYASQFPTGKPLIVDHAERFEFVYPEGPHDAETLLVDPLNGDLYILTKRIWPTEVYRAAAPFVQGKTTTLAKTNELKWIGIAAGDISGDGRQILLKTYDQVLHWQRQPQQSVSAALTATPDSLTYIPEPQGEALAFNATATGYFTMGEEIEGIPAAVSFYPLDPAFIDSLNEP